ncbi:hypothetical protein BC938DRAFT_473823 [Jimgerdemannia flammicorona]|uniref:Myb-like domain-containing protein n=1 Tax=Jimgerdemannia flammicorona TaxID=994334 RepID=A0A433QT05_9FUNG|nr:hypothetical protein BC938DRAFT_473823 [Jimgerdemannia flammicorona]
MSDRIGKPSLRKLGHGTDDNVGIKGCCTHSSSSSTPTVRFTKEDDKAILDAFERHPNDWEVIASEVSKATGIQRSSRQCAFHYNRALNLKLVTGPWTEEEDKILNDAYNCYGPRYSMIARQPRRASGQGAHKGTTPSTNEQLLQIYSGHGELYKNNNILLESAVVVLSLTNGVVANRVDGDSRKGRQEPAKPIFCGMHVLQVDPTPQTYTSWDSTSQRM